MRVQTLKLLSALCLAPMAASTPAGLLDVTPAQGEAFGCGTDCQDALNAGNVQDRLSVGADFDFDFYATASNFSSSLEPGTVLKFEAMDPTTLDISSGTTIYRMQYTTKDYDGAIVPSTGFIALPFTPNTPLPNDPDVTKYRLVAYAHGTVGLYAACAPSNGNALYDFETWKPLVSRGYAVVATDYAGLGNNHTSHKYIYHPAHANDIKYAVVAARALFGAALTDQWMSIGRSQGGGAVWKLAESEHVRNDPDYLGTVAIAPATYTIDMILDNIGSIFGRRRRRGRIERRAEQETGYLTFLTTAVERVFPDFKARMLSEAAQKRVELAEANGLCASAMLKLGTGLTPLQLVDLDQFAVELPALKRFQNETSAALGDRSPAPIMVVQGLNDTTIQPETTRQAWENSCGFGNELHLRLYEGMEHGPVQTAAMPEFLAWMDAVFAGRTHGSCPRRCTTAQRKAFDGKFVKP